MILSKTPPKEGVFPSQTVLFVAIFEIKTNSVYNEF